VKLGKIVPSAALLHNQPNTKNKPKHHNVVAIEASALASCAICNNTSGAAVLTPYALNNTNTILR
jgi:hypothetical protein